MIYDFEFRKNIKQKRLYEAIAKEILGAWDAKSFTEIKKKYLQLAKKYHPDINNTNYAKKKFQDIALSYKVLTSWDDSLLNEKFSTIDEFELKIIMIKAKIKDKTIFGRFHDLY